MQLGYFKVYDDAQDLKFGTEQAACFDIEAYLKSGNPVKGYDSTNNKVEADVEHDNSIDIMPGERMLIETGLIFDIPEGYSLRLHPRSSTGYKLGLSIPHSEGIIDSDYYHQTYIVLLNTTKLPVTIKDGQKLLQGELVKSLKYDIVETKEKPEQKTDRIGGLGSTGV